MSELNALEHKWTPSKPVLFLKNIEGNYPDADSITLIEFLKPKALNTNNNLAQQKLDSAEKAYPNRFYKNIPVYSRPDTDIEYSHRYDGSFKDGVFYQNLGY